MPMFTREEAAAKLRAQGWGERAIAAALARDYPPDPAGRVMKIPENHDHPDDGIVRDPNAVEADEQKAIWKLALTHGFRWRSTSTTRRARIFPGCPDLILVHRVLPLWTWWETKRQIGGELSPDQIEFRDDCLRCGIPWHSGDRYAFEAWLLETGVAVRQGEQLVPRRPWIALAEQPGVEPATYPSAS